MEIRKHHQWRPGTVFARAACPGEPGKNSDELTDEQVVLLADIASTGISAVESAECKSVIR
jgi:orotate phosphoribosyltransferase